MSATIAMCADEARERNIQQDHWDTHQPTSSVGEILRMQDVVRFNAKMDTRYGHLRTIAKHEVTT